MVTGVVACCGDRPSVCTKHKHSPAKGAHSSHAAAAALPCDIGHGRIRAAAAAGSYLDPVDPSVIYARSSPLPVEEETLEPQWGKVVPGRLSDAA